MGNPIQKVGPHLKAHPDCINALADAGFDVVGLANNHITDYGQAGIQETLAQCDKKNLITCGAGVNINEALKPVFLDRENIRIAFIAVAEREFNIADTHTAGAAPLDLIDTLYQIEYTRKNADLVFVSIHGGNEYFPYPRPGLRKMCRFFIEKGADAIICNHPHIPGAYEIYKDKLIVYSLGNLIFYKRNPPAGWSEGYTVYLEFTKTEKNLSRFILIPYTQSVEQEGVHKMKDKEKDAFLVKISSYSNIVNNNEHYHKAWDDFCRRKTSISLLRFLSPVYIRGIDRMNKFIPPIKKLISPATLDSRLNMIRCESHLELLQHILEER
jgi:poly-gamma-glutamate synthesis protein (capsule biosynthesis protein)